ncbi:MAG: cysteine hydrolase [Actinobacteria bacterium]|uniref:Isochorismatase family protein n=1 Tax=Nostocoides veronense TaxID=330836 RepID=A0ABP4XIS2_9MICO|nr:cysteine hydrolase [Actinomycetota bacterium]
MTSAPLGTDDWLVIIDPQAIFADPTTSAWGSPMFAGALPDMVALAAAYGPERTVITRFVAEPGLGGSWGSYYDDWPFALVPDTDPLYAVVPALDGLAGHVVTEPRFGKWSDRLRAVLGEQPRVTLAGVSTDCCVIATALPAADAGATIRIAAAACAGSTPENHQRALDAMALFGPQIVIG